MGRKQQQRLPEKKSTPAQTEKYKPRVPEKQMTSVKDFSPKNDKQIELVNSIKTKEVTFVTGASGCGKTYVSLATALNLLDNKYKRIVLIKSVTPLPGEDIGYIPGDFLEKMAPFLYSFTGNIDKLCGFKASEELIRKNLIEVQPLAFIRGINIDNAIVILDEAQNLSNHIFKSVITRIGTDSKYIVLGDVEQIDRKVKDTSCLQKMVDIFRDSDFIGTVEFGPEDCVRNPIIPRILDKLREKGI